MNISLSLQQIKKDIQSGKSTMIYYSTNSLWWTHLSSDVEAATSMGKITRELRWNAIMSSTDVPVMEKERMQSLRKQAGGWPDIPLDPSGSTIYQFSNPIEWIMNAEECPGHYGKHGLNAFLLVHHQNCSNICFHSWATVNAKIDQIISMN